MLRLGIDLGGTKMEIIALDGVGNELSRRRMPTPQGDYRATLAAITQLVTVTEKRSEAEIDAFAALLGRLGGR